MRPDSTPGPDVANAHPETFSPSRKKKPEDTAEGCRAMAADDRVRAAAMGSDRMRFRLERSADAWAARAHLLERLEANFNARVEARRNSDG